MQNLLSTESKWLFTEDSLFLNRPALSLLMSILCHGLLCSHLVFSVLDDSLVLLLAGTLDAFRSRILPGF